MRFRRTAYGLGLSLLLATLPTQAWQPQRSPQLAFQPTPLRQSNSRELAVITQAHFVALIHGQLKLSILIRKASAWS